MRVAAVIEPCIAMPQLSHPLGCRRGCNQAPAQPRHPLGVQLRLPHCDAGVLLFGGSLGCRERHCQRPVRAHAAHRRLCGAPGGAALCARRGSQGPRLPRVSPALPPCSFFLLAALASSLSVAMLLIGAWLGRFAMLACMHIVAARGARLSRMSPALHPASCTACCSSTTAACILAGLALRAALQPKMAQCDPGWVGVVPCLCFHVFWLFNCPSPTLALTHH